MTDSRTSIDKVDYGLHGVYETQCPHDPAGSQRALVLLCFSCEQSQRVGCYDPRF